MRWLRSFLVAALTACSAGLAHAGAGGHRAPLPLLVALTLVGGPAMYALSGRRWRFGHLAAVMGLAQIALHASMTTLMPMRGMSVAESSCHGHLVVGPGGDIVDGAMTPTMLLVHVGTTLVLAGLLAHGERLLHWTMRRLSRLPHRVPALLPRPRPMPLHRCRRLTSILPRAPGGSRAPPHALVFSH